MWNRKNPYKTSAPNAINNYQKVTVSSDNVHVVLKLQHSPRADVRGESSRGKRVLQLMSPRHWQRLPPQLRDKILQHSDSQSVKLSVSQTTSQSDSR